MPNWGAVDRILWMGVMCLVTWFVAICGLLNFYVPIKMVYFYFDLDIKLAKLCELQLTVLCSIITEHITN
jgi:hypothetical protein